MHTFGNIILRRYQERGLNAFEKWLPLEGDKLATIILPTGTGKTALACACVDIALKNKPYKILWCAHREELIDQAARELKVIPDKKLEVEMADQRASKNADIVVGTVQTLHRNRKNMQDFVPDIIIVDEWHHYADTNKQYHGLLEKFPNAKFLGLTATPYRFMGGDLPLGSKLIEMDIGLAVAHNYLVPPKPEALKSDVSLANVKTRAGDFAINELSEAVNVERRNKLIADRLIKAIKEENRKGILFGVDVAHAKAMAELLRKDVRVEEIYGETDKEERRAAMARVRSGNMDVLVNNLVVTEGFDIPYIDFICVARPTKSLGLYCQMVGRGLRLSEGKTDCLIIDVHDMVKVTQKRVTYQQLAAAGDIDGSRRRFDSILKEKIANKIENFPITIRLKAGEQWVVDEDTWFAPSWQLEDNQWVLCWTKTSETIDTGITEWAPMTRCPRKDVIKQNPMVVRHESYGEGIAHDLEFTSVEPFLVVDFDKYGTKNILYSQLQRETIKFDKKRLTNPVKRAFYICLNDEGTKGRVIGVQQEGREFIVNDDIIGDKTTISEMVRAAASKDDMLSVLKTNSKWRSRPATDKQKEYIQRSISWGKISTDIDISTLTGGDASSLIDQMNWKDIINRIFGTQNRSSLIGYNILEDDI